MLLHWPKAAVLALAIALGVAVSQAPSVAAGALLHPARTVAPSAAPHGCEERQFPGAGITLTGWSCSGTGPTRGSVVYLHGMADNRGTAAGMIHRFTRRGFNVIAYDSRAHGKSGGSMCTYGFYEKQDLRRVLDTLPVLPVILMGTSLGGSVALQAAADDTRVTGIVAAEVFSDLATVVRERVPAFVPDRVIRSALRIAGHRGRFAVEQVSPVAAARSIRVPVLLIHGAADRDTTPGHSQRVFEALAGPKRLLLVPGARHNESLRGAETWREIERWIDALVSRCPESASTEPGARSARRPRQRRASRSVPRTESRSADTRC